jgi:hypothetical protein
MLHLPPTIAALYRPAADHEVHSRSFGAVKFPRNPKAEGWEQQRNTLADQAIFGPQRDFECVCGKYRGSEHRNMICDRCGVKITTSAARRRRFGHIDLQAFVLHPLGRSEERLSTIPVLPAAFIESREGRRVGECYDDLARSALSGSLGEMVSGLNQLVELLLPLATIAHDWSLQDAKTFAWGLALERRTDLRNDTCGYCGYPLEGLTVPACPGCGKDLR